MGCIRNFLLGSVLVSAVGAAQDLSKPITYRTVAIPLYVALEQMSKQAGVSLTVTEDLQNEPIILSLKGAPTQDVMDHIATAVGAEWQKRSDKEFLLRRTDEIERKLFNESIARREAVIKKSVDRLAKDLDSSGPLEIYAQKTGQALAASIRLIETKSDTSTYNSLRSRYPGRRALISLLRMMPTRMLAEVDPSETVVFSTDPNSRQQKLPDAADAVIDEFVREQNFFAEAFGKAHPGELPLDFRKRLKKKVAVLTERPAKLLLIVQGTRFSSGAPFLRLVIIGTDGTAVGYGSESLSREDSQAAYAKGQAMLASSAKLPEIPLSPESEIVSSACEAGVTKAGNPPALTAAQKAMLLNPETHDPLSFLISDGFLALADETNGNLIAYPSDATFSMNFMKAEDKSYKLPRFLAALPLYGMAVQTEGGWTVAKPVDPLDETNRRTDRHLFGECLREAGQNGYVSIAAAAQLALSERKNDADLPWLYGILGREYLPYSDSDKRVLKFYSSLTSSQIEALEQGVKLTAGAMTKEQWSLFEEVAYRGSGEVILPVIDEYGDSGDYALNYEATEHMPDGLPNDASVAMKFSDRDILFGGFHFDSGYEYFNEISIEEIANSIATKQAGVKTDWNIDVRWVSPGRARELLFNFYLTPKFLKGGQLRESTRSDEKWAIDNLPPELKKKLDAAIVMARAKLDKQANEPQPEPVAKPPL